MSSSRASLCADERPRFMFYENTNFLKIQGGVLSKESLCDFLKRNPSCGRVSLQIVGSRVRREALLPLSRSLTTIFCGTAAMDGNAVNINDFPNLKSIHANNLQFTLDADNTADGAKKYICTFKPFAETILPPLTHAEMMLDAFEGLKDSVTIFRVEGDGSASNKVICSYPLQPNILLPVIRRIYNTKNSSDQSNAITTDTVRQIVETTFPEDAASSRVSEDRQSITLRDFSATLQDFSASSLLAPPSALIIKHSVSPSISDPKECCTIL